LRAVFGLALRQTEGLIGSIMQLLEIDLPIPDHTTLSRFEKLGTTRRRARRKLHIGIDADTGEIVASDLTDKDVDDASHVGPMLDQLSSASDFIHGRRSLR
jgi:IS5 family transposase